MNTDADDLQEFVAHGSEPAFRRIVERHARMVHGVACRSTRDHHLAEEIMQAVFILLARKARAVPSGHLSGWLHRAATGECRNAVRKETRRHRLHQQYAETMNEHSSPAEQWASIAPHLDQAVGRLSAVDRELVLLRYFEDRSFQEIATSTGRSVEACRKRAQRALERLGGHLRKQGVVVAGVSLAPALSFGALPPVPVSAVVISSTALNAAAASSGSAAGLFGFIQLMTTKQITAGAILIFALAAIPAAFMAKNRSDTKPLKSSSVNGPEFPVKSDSAGKPSGATDRSKDTGKAGGAVNWAELARTKFVSRNDLIQLKDAADLAARFKELSNEELLKGLDEITGQDISMERKLALREVLIAELSKRDPMLVLNRLAQDKENPILTVGLMGAFDALLAKDPAAAGAWLKSQVANGNLAEAPSQPGGPVDRFMFESSILRRQAQSDPDGASQRILAYPEMKQAEMLMAAANMDFPSAFHFAMESYKRSGDDSLVNRLMDSDQLVHGIFFGRNAGVEQMHKLVDQMPNTDAKAAAHARVDEMAKNKPEGVPLDLLLEGEK